jgi:fructose-1,6-bisphosphatase/inositol monophosphatase family enzyme
MTSLYIAERGKGAFLNDQRLRVAGRRQLERMRDRLRPAAYRPRRP